MSCGSPRYRARCSVSKNPRRVLPDRATPSARAAAAARSVGLQVDRCSADTPCLRIETRFALARASFLARKTTSASLSSDSCHLVTTLERNASALWPSRGSFAKHRIRVPRYRRAKSRSSGGRLRPMSRISLPPDVPAASTSNIARDRAWRRDRKTVRVLATTTFLRDVVAQCRRQRLLSRRFWLDQLDQRQYRGGLTNCVAGQWRGSRRLLASQRSQSDYSSWTWSPGRRAVDPRAAIVCVLRFGRLR